MDFNIRNLAVLELFGQEIWMTETHMGMWIIMGIMIALAIIVRISLSAYKDIPKGFQNVMELIVETFDKFVRGAAGDRLAFLAPWFFTVFVFILLSNWSGMFLLRPPTADWSVTVALAVVTFVLIQVLGAKYAKKDYWKSFLSPFPLFIPVNILGELAKPVSLSFRLFGNILSGVILMSLLYGLLFPFTLIYPAFLHIFFDVVVGLLQAYLFTVLSLSFIGVSAGTSE